MHINRGDCVIALFAGIEVSFMSQTGNFMYGVSERLRATVVELPYAHQQFSMVSAIDRDEIGNYIVALIQL